MLRFIQRPETDPYYNLAAEEYILKSAQADSFMTWTNEPSVIVGKHQNALKEIDPIFVEQNYLPLIRRITGGGTVYHDPGNINFSFIFINRKDNLIDFKEFTRPIILFLQNLGLKAHFEGKNNITVNGLKVSGNSAHLHKNKVLYHGTLLFDSNLDILEKAIKGNENHFQDKAVRSIRSKVINIKHILQKDLSIQEFIDLFREYIFKYYGGYYEENLNENDRSEILKLVENKYKTYEWNYGYSPDYVFINKWMFENEEYSVNLIVKDGIIDKARITGPEPASVFLDNLSFLLPGILHDKSAIQQKISTLTTPSDKDYKLMNQMLNKLF